MGVWLTLCCWRGVYPSDVAFICLIKCFLDDGTISCCPPEGVLVDFPHVKCCGATRLCLYDAIFRPKIDRKAFKGVFTDTMPKPCGGTLFARGRERKISSCSYPFKKGRNQLSIGLSRAAWHCSILRDEKATGVSRNHEGSDLHSNSTKTTKP